MNNVIEKNCLHVCQIYFTYMYAIFLQSESELLYKFQGGPFIRHIVFACTFPYLLINTSRMEKFSKLPSIDNLSVTH